MNAKQEGPTSDLDNLIAAWLDGRIDETDSEKLQEQLLVSGAARARLRELTQLDAALRELADAPSVSGVDPKILMTASPDSSIHWPAANRFALATSLLGIAVAILLIAGLAYQFGKGQERIASRPSTSMQAIPPERKPPIDQPRDQLSIDEPKLSGYATLRRAAGMRWSPDSRAYRAGDVLQAGLLQFEEGVAEIDFFCGATLVVEGPAKMILESDWSLQLLSGRLRANVPPAARGFIVKAADSEIIDLGTEFAVEVGAQTARVEVLEGEVKLRGGQHDGNHLVTGQTQSLRGSDSNPGSLKSLTTIDDVRKRHASSERRRFREWSAASKELRKDKRLIAYYPIGEFAGTRQVTNAAATGSDRDGTLVGLVNESPGRFGDLSSGLEFGRPGARVRTLIDGEYDAFTFTCWTRIDSLDHVYNALFMSDGYEKGELHWQIRDDGRLMFSVMVDDSVKIPKFDKIEQKTVTTAGLHRVYFSDPFWDVSKSGQWFHIAAVYDPVRRMVTQYVNGEQVGHEAIQETFFIDSLRIGPAEIGNWGQPFRQSAWFAVRNLNGTIDELAIFNAALDSSEISLLYDQGKPLGY